MKKMYGVALVGLILILSCGKEKPGNIDVTLDFDASVTQMFKDAMTQFVFVIGEVGSTQKLLYPSACLGCATKTSPCPEADQCLKSTTCGFPTTASTFDPQINFSDIAQNKTMEITACALDNASPIASGQGQVKNQTGTKLKITLSTTVDDCINNLPPSLCP